MDAEKGWKRDVERAMQNLLHKMYKNGLSIELIASATDKTIEEVKTIIEGKEKSQEA